MNVLMFTMTMILLLATMTYARLESFKSHQITKVQFESTMGVEERRFLNNKAKEWYKSIIVNSKNNTSNPPKSKNQNPRTGTSKLSWSIFIDSNERDKDPSKLKQVIDISQKLIISLFPKDSNAQKMLAANPQLMDNLFLGLMEASDKLPKNLKIKEAPHLASLELTDPELNLFRYELFKESIYPDEVRQQEVESVKSTYSLLDHLTLAPAKTRLFLASKELLRAACNGDENLVSAILEKRDYFYKAVKNKHLDKPQASTEFKSFIEELAPQLKNQLFDFSVTKTDPRKFE